MKGLAKAQQDLREFLAANPHLMTHQNLIERALNQAGGDVGKRLEIIRVLLTDNLEELAIELKILQKQVDNLVGLLED